MQHKTQKNAQRCCIFSIVNNSSLFQQIKHKTTENLLALSSC